MGLLSRLLNGLLGASAEGNEDDRDGRPGRDVGPEHAAESDRAPEHGQIAEPAKPVDEMSVRELIEAEPIASGRRKSDILAELLDRGAENPRSFHGHLEELLERLEGDAAGENASMVLETLAAADPDLLTEHVDRLIAALDDATEESATDLTDTLGHLRETVSLPADELLDLVAEGAGPVRSPVTTLLGTIAVREPTAIDVDRLVALSREGDATGRASALYLGTLLAGGERDREVPGEIVAEGVVELADAVRDGGLNPWIMSTLSRVAIEEIVDDVAPEANWDGLDIAQTPMGTQIVLEAEKPEAVTGQGEKNIQKIKTKLEDRINLEDPQIKVHEAGKEPSGSDPSEDDVTLSDISERGE